MLKWFGELSSNAKGLLGVISVASMCYAAGVASTLLFGTPKRVAALEMQGAAQQVFLADLAGDVDDLQHNQRQLQCYIAHEDSIVDFTRCLQARGPAPRP